VRSESEYEHIQLSDTPEAAKKKPQTAEKISFHLLSFKFEHLLIHFCLSPLLRYIGEGLTYSRHRPQTIRKLSPCIDIMKYPLKVGGQIKHYPIYGRA